jgi:tripartite-type tricarboxylate transporter receptor subunit TctC
MTGRGVARLWPVILSCLAISLGSDVGFAQTYPTGTIKIIEAYPAGGAGDLIARLVGEKLSAVLKNPVIVVNRPGAGGTIGAKSVVNSAADGLTILQGHPGEIAINPIWTSDSGYDPDKDLVPVGMVAILPLALVVRSNAPYSTVADMLKAANDNTRGLLFASSGTATPAHFAGEMLKFKSNANLTHVPYSGASPALVDLLGGQVDFYFSGFPPVLPQVKSGALKILAVSSANRSALAPDIPTVAETPDFKGFDITLWLGLFVPRGTPQEICDRLSNELKTILADPEIKRKFAELGADPAPMTTDQFTAFVKSEREKYAELIKAAHLAPPRDLK